MGLAGTLLRYRYEVRSEADYFDEVQDVKVTKDIVMKVLELTDRAVLESSIAAKRCFACGGHRAAAVASM